MHPCLKKLYVRVVPVLDTSRNGRFCPERSRLSLGCHLSASSGLPHLPHWTKTHSPHQHWHTDREGNRETIREEPTEQQKDKGVRQRATEGQNRQQDRQKEDNGPHSRTVLTNKFVLKSYLRRFYEDCGIHEFFSYPGFFLGKNKSYEHSGVLLSTFQCRHVGMLVLSSFVKFNKIHYSEISVIFMYLFIHLIFFSFFILITLNVPML